MIKFGNELPLLKYVKKTLKHLGTGLGHKRRMKKLCRPLSATRNGNKLNSEENHITIFFRYDDFSARTSFDLEKQVIEAFQNTGNSLTIGIIPFITRGDIHDPGKYGNDELSYVKLSFLREAILSGTVDPALHGYEHKNFHAGRPYSEFRGLSSDVQYNKLLKAATLFKQMLGFWPSTFIPPWNTYDHRTLKALDRLKIPNISANIYGNTNSPTLTFLPVTSGLEQLPAALEEAINLDCENVLIGIILHQFDFFESKDNRSSMSIRSLHGLLAKMKYFQNTQILSISQILQLPYLYKGYRCWANKPPSIKCLTPPYIKKNSFLLYLPAHKALRKKINILLHVFLLYALILTITTIAVVLHTANHYKIIWIFMCDALSTFGTTIALLIKYIRNGTGFTIKSLLCLLNIFY